MFETFNTGVAPTDTVYCVVLNYARLVVIMEWSERLPKHRTCTCMLRSGLDAHCPKDRYAYDSMASYEYGTIIGPVLEIVRFTQSLGLQMIL